MSYAIIEDRSIQYKVSEGQEIAIQRWQDEAAKTIQFDKVLLLANGKEAQIGQPYVSGSKVTASVLEHVLDEKIVVFKYKRKTGYRNKRGHRQHLTLIKIEKIG
jgi:large subunit ribosomal protein L21